MPNAGRDQFQRAVADLSAIPKEIRKDLTPALRKVGEKAAADARRRADWSTRIPGAIRVRVLYGKRTQGVLLQVSRKKAPHARPYEGISSGSRVFRHPFFGDRERWYAQRTKPFLKPAALAAADEARGEVIKVVDAAARRHGFH